MTRNSPSTSNTKRHGNKPIFNRERSRVANTATRTTAPTVAVAQTGILVTKNGATATHITAETRNSNGSLTSRAVGIS